MTSIHSVTLEAPDPAAAEAVCAALGVGPHVGVRASQAPTTGSWGFTLSLVVSQPSTVDVLIAAAIDAGATTLRPATTSLWGYGGVVSVTRSFGGEYAELATPGSPITLALYERRGLAEVAGVPAEGTGSHRIVIGSDAGPFTDPDGFAWEPASLPAGPRAL